MKLTAKALKALPPKTLAWDSEVAGFGARVGARGDVSLFLNYQDRNTGKYHRQAVGKLSEISVDAARKRAAELKLEVRAGVNPSTKVATPAARMKSGETFGQYVETWLAQGRGPKGAWSPTTRGVYEAAVTRELRDAPIWDHNIEDVARKDLMKLIDAATARSVGSGTLLFRVLSSFLNWADARELTQVRLPKQANAVTLPDARTRVMTDEEIRALWHATGTLTPDVRAAGRLVLLTALRSGSVQAFKPDWLRQDGLTIPASAMKSKREFWVPLTPWGYEQVQGLAPMKPRRLTNVYDTWRKRAGLDADLRLHDVRRSLKTWAMTKNLPDLASEAALAHTVQKSDLARAYMQHNFSDEGSEVLRKWQRHVKEVVT